MQIFSHSNILLAQKLKMLRKVAHFTLAQRSLSVTQRKLQERELIVEKLTGNLESMKLLLNFEKR